MTNLTAATHWKQCWKNIARTFSWLLSVIPVKMQLLLSVNKKPDLVFLDIEMPRMNGFDMLQKIGSVNFEIIFTTSFDQYALRAIRFSALDYLLKPIDKG
jgi:two-component SAPR family response regulator